MVEINKTNFTQDTNPIQPQQLPRLQSLIDILYLTNVTWFYIFSLIYPLFGIILGIILSTGSISQPAKKIGRVCLILGIINIVLSILILIILILIGNIFAKFNPYSL